MPAATLKNVRLLTGGYEVTSDHNQGTLTRSKDAIKATVFGQDSHVYRPGLKRADYTLNGYFDSDGTSAVDDVHELARVASGSQVLTIVNPDVIDAVNEIQSIYNDATGGTFTVSFDGQGPSGNLAYDVSAANLKTALELFSNITSVTVTGAGTFGDPWLVTFTDPGAEDVAMITADDGNLTGETVGTTITEDTKGVAYVSASAHSFEAIDSSLTPFGGSIGGMAAFTVAGSGVGESFRGRVFEPGTTARSSSSNSDEYLIGSVAAGETAYAALHVIAITSTPTLDVIIESDTTGFPSGDTKITFPQATAVGDGFLTSTTVTADTYWRAAWTFGGSGDITFLVTFGIH